MEEKLYHKPCDFIFMPLLTIGENRQITTKSFGKTKAIVRK